MNNDALIAALGLDAVAAVHGYRLAVFSEAQQRGVSLVSEALSEVVPISSGVCIMIDPIDIRLAFTGDGVEQITAGASLTWNPAQGWCFSPPGGMPARFYAGPAATPLDLVPEAPQVLDWATGPPDGASTPPICVDLDDDPAVLRRLLGFIDCGRRSHTARAVRPWSQSCSA